MPGNWRKGVVCVGKSQFREDHIRSAENEGKCKVMWGQGEEIIYKNRTIQKNFLQSGYVLYLCCSI